MCEVPLPPARPVFSTPSAHRGASYTKDGYLHLLLLCGAVTQVAKFKLQQHRNNIPDCKIPCH